MILCGIRFVATNVLVPVNVVYFKTCHFTHNEEFNIQHSDVSGCCSFADMLRMHDKDQFIIRYM